MSAGDRYNGSANWETWIVKSWLASDENTYDSLVAVARRARSLYDLSKALESVLTDQALDLVGTASLFTDLLTSSLREVCWQEVAESFWEAAGNDDDTSDDDADLDDEDDGGAL
jgi:hypothetical protein